MFVIDISNCSFVILEVFTRGARHHCMTRKEEEISFHTLHPPYLFWRAGPSEREERKENPADSSGKSGAVRDLERIPLKPSEQECGDGVDVGHVYLGPKAAC